MAGLINELIDVLTETRVNIESLIELSEHKKDIIIKNDVDTLKRITSRENILAGRCQKLDRKRAAVCKDIALVLNEKEAGLTLARLGEIISDQVEHEPFVEASEKLSAALLRLKELNDVNRELIEGSLEYIDFSVNVIRSTFGNDEAFMDDTGREGSGKNFIDSKN